MFNKEMFEQWNGFGKSSLSPMMDFGSMCQEIGKQYAMQFSGATFEQFNTNVKHVQELPACKNMESFMALYNQTANKTAENCLNLCKSAFDTTMESANKMTEWMEKQYSSLAQQQEASKKSK